MTITTGRAERADTEPAGVVGTLAPRTIASLRARLRGSVVAPGDGDYDRVRRAWNLEVDHRPALVVLAEDAEDVRQTVSFAAGAGVGVAVLSTGHGTGRPVDGGVLLNTSRMRGVVIDPLARMARVEAGARWTDVVPAAAAHGLAGLPGSSTSVGVVGYTLGGGFGWLGRRYGLAAHSAVRAEVVTAGGRLVTADADEHPDLWWGLRGGTGNLGVVTGLEFRLHPVRRVYGGNLYYPLTRAADVLAFFADWSRSAPPELTAAVSFRRFPPAPSVPEPLRGSALVALRGCYCGRIEAGRALVDQARRALGPAAVDNFGVLPVADLARISMDPVDPIGVRTHTDLLHELTPPAMAALLEVAGPDSGSPLVMVELRQLGGALTGPPDALSPMAHTQASFSLNAVGVTSTPAQAAATRQHLRRVANAVAPYVTGETYLNFLELDGATPERVRAAYSARDWDRLVRLKGRYDPQQTFRFNRNVPAPASTSDPKVSTP